MTEDSGAPQISQVSARAYRVPTESPEADGTFAWDATTMVLVEVTAGGTRGLGWTYGPVACESLIEDLLAPVLIGRSPVDLPGSVCEMWHSVRNVGAPGVAAYAVSAVDVALWDLKARLLSVSLGDLLGRVREEVPLYGSGGFTTYDDTQLAAEVDGWLEQGMTRMKIKIAESAGTRTDRDIARIRQLRALAGDQTELFVDANGGYTAKQAVRVLHEVDELDVRWMEEPVSSDDLAGLGIVRAAVRADVAAGEYGTRPWYFRRMCQAGAVDCLQADASRCGGISGWSEVAAMAASFGMEVSGHCAPQLHLDVAAAIPNLRHLEYFKDHARIESMFFDGVAEVDSGNLRAQADRLGLGLELREQDVEEYRIR